MKVEDYRADVSPADSESIPVSNDDPIDGFYDALIDGNRRLDHRFFEDSKQLQKLTRRQQRRTRRRHPRHLLTGAVVFVGDGRGFWRRNPPGSAAVRCRLFVLTRSFPLPASVDLLGCVESIARTRMHDPLHAVRRRSHRWLPLIFDRMPLLFAHC